MTSRVLNIVCKFNLHFFLRQGLHFAFGFAFLKMLQEFRVLAFEEARSRPRLFEKMREGLRVLHTHWCMPSQGELVLFLREKNASKHFGASKRYGAFYFLRLTNRSIVASPNERNEVGLGEGEKENLLNSKFVDQQQIFFHCTGGKINRKGREWKRYFAGHVSQY